MKRSCIHAGDIRIPEQQQHVMAAQPRKDLDSGMQILSRKLLECTFICIKPQAYHVGADRNHYFGAEIFFCQ
jgi:hypothetical protein